jgi:hypothetical protein
MFITDAFAKYNHQSDFQLPSTFPPPSELPALLYSPLELPHNFTAHIGSECNTGAPRQNPSHLSLVRTRLCAEIANHGVQPEPGDILCLRAHNHEFIRRVEKLLFSSWST